MLYHKKTSLGEWAKKGEDIKDQDIITVLNEGQTDESGEFGPRQVFLVQLVGGEEKNVAFNQTSINNMIDAFGEDSAKWVGKKVKVWLVRQNVAGKFVQVLYVSSPKAIFGDEGFVLSNEMDYGDVPVIENEND